MKRRASPTPVFFAQTDFSGYFSIKRINHMLWDVSLAGYILYIKYKRVKIIRYIKKRGKL